MDQKPKPTVRAVDTKIKTTWNALRDISVWIVTNVNLYCQNLNHCFRRDVYDSLTIAGFATATTAAFALPATAFCLLHV